MAANDYELCVSAMTSTVYLSKKSKRGKGTMLEDRRVIEKKELIPAIIAFAKTESGKSDTVIITAGGKSIAQIKLLVDKSELL